MAEVAGLTDGWETARNFQAHFFVQDGIQSSERVGEEVKVAGIG